MLTPGIVGVPAGADDLTVSCTAAHPSLAWSRGSNLARRDEVVLVALLPSTRRARLAAALTRGVRIYAVESCTQLRGARGLVPDAIVVDPLAGESSADMNQALSAVAPSCSLIVYTSLTPGAMRRLLDLPTLAGASLILAGVDDTAEIIRETISAVRLSTHRHRTLDELRSRAGPLPSDVSSALENLVMDGGRKLTVVGLARAAHMCVRTLERRLDEVGAPPPVWLIKTARAFLARELLCSSSLTVQEVAQRVGYAKLDSLRMLLRWSFDSSPSVLRNGPHLASGPRWEARSGVISRRRRRRNTTIAAQTHGRAGMS